MGALHSIEVMVLWRNIKEVDGSVNAKQDSKLIEGSGSFTPNAFWQNRWRISDYLRSARAIPRAGRAKFEKFPNASFHYSTYQLIIQLTESNG